MKWIRTSLATAMAVLILASCATVSEPVRDSEHSAIRAPVGPRATNPDQGVFLGTEEPESSPGVEETEIYVGEGAFIDEGAARRPAHAVSEDGEIVLNFEGEAIQSVIHTILGEVLQETFVIGPGVSGEVTFATARPVTREQLMPILELLLRWNGATMVYSEGRYHILPVSEAIKGHLSPVLGGDAPVRGYEVRAVPLEFISAAEMAKILEPYVRDGAVVRVDPGRSMLFLAGTAEELDNYLRTIRIFDVDWLAGMSVGIYPLKTVDVESITQELTSVFGTEAESPLAGMFRFVPLERLGSIMVITPQPKYLEKAQEWIDILDRGQAGGGEQLFVYKVKNLEASVLAGYLTQLFGGSSTGRQRGNQGGALAPGLEPVQVGNVQQFNDSRVGAGGSSATQRNRGASGTQVLETELGEIRITSVQETNSLLIQATTSQYDSILAAIERIDEQPLQVLIESQVLEVELTEDLSFGVNWFLSNNPDLIPENSGNPFNRYVDFVEFGGATNFFTQITRPLTDGKSFVQATISALDSVTDVRSLAAPSLLVRNNAQATITVGTQVPVQSSSISTGSDNVVSNAQYVSTGVTLTVTPRINPGGLVYMDISQEVSRPGARDPDVSTSGNPPINSKSVTSQVAVQSGQTVFLGGLINEQSSEGRTGVPFLNRVPGIGRLFGSTTDSDTRSETIVMITPTVIETSADLRAVSDDMEEEFSRVPPFDIERLQDR